MFGNAVDAVLPHLTLHLDDVNTSRLLTPPRLLTGVQLTHTLVCGLVRLRTEETVVGLAGVEHEGL